MSKFYQEIVKLKSVMRKGWKVDSVDLKVGRCESVAEHTFSATLLACEIMEREKLNHLDKYKVLKMVLIHDLCEIDKGNHTPFDNITNEEKFNTEVVFKSSLAVSFCKTLSPFGFSIRQAYEELLIISLANPP